MVERERLTPEAPWTRSQTAAFLKCHPDTVSDLIAAGEIQQQDYCRKGTQNGTTRVS